MLVRPGLPQEAAAQSAPVGQLTSAINGFGIDMLRASITSEAATTNTIVSPLSVHAALSMTANGASGETGEQMAGVLGTDSMGAAETNRQWAALLAALGQRSTRQTLDIANSLWAQEGIAFKRPFLDADRKFFGAQVSTLDLHNADAPRAINAWVSKNTRGMIPSIIEQVPEEAILYLVNAVYFNGRWVHPFTPDDTHKKPFTRADGSPVQVEMMNTKRRMPYSKTAVLQATALPYQGGDTAFYVLLPEPGVKMDAAIASLEGTGLSDLREEMRSAGETEVVLGLPKLDAEFSTELKASLSALGMPRAFDATDAQFSKMASLDATIYISRVLHKTKIKVDEEGTEAAAATAVGVATGGMDAAPRIEPPRIICDRPYLFAVVDEKSGAMLFLGVVNDPRD